MGVRILKTEEWPLAWPIIAQLRKLDEVTFLQRVNIQASCGYQLVGAFKHEALIAVMGIRPVHTLARGLHLHIDDLIVDSRSRTAGVGKELMSFAEELARQQGMTAIFLDARPDAIPFYEKLQFMLHQSPSMRKGL